MVVDGIHKNHGIDLLYGSFLPLFYDGEDLIRDPADGAVRDIYVIELFHIGFNIPGGHTLCVHGENLFLHIPITGVHGLCEMTVSAVIKI